MIPAIDRWGGMMNQEVIVTKGSTSTGRDFYGSQQITGTATTHKARYVGNQHMTVDSQGRETLANGTVWLGKTSTGGLPSLAVTDRLTLPSGSNPVLLNVETFVDDAGDTHHQVAHLG